MAKFVVTGCAGFIGSHIVKTLLEQEHQVVGLDNLSSGFNQNIDYLQNQKNSNLFTCINGDIRNLKDCKDACKDADYVCHQAALGSVPASIADPALYNDNNISGTLNMLIAAKDSGIKRFVFASSSSIYGDDPELPKIETMSPNPLSPYALTKITGEHYCEIFYKQFQLKTVSLRYFNVFGPRQNPKSQYAAAIPAFITKYLNSESPTIYGDGEQTRDFIYIQNTVEANINACLSNDVTFGTAYNIGGGSRISINNLVDKIKEIINNKLNPNYEIERNGDIKHSVANIEKAKKATLIQKVAPLDQGLAKTIEWYKQ